MAPNDRSFIKWTLGSAFACGMLFAGLSVSRALTAGASPFAHLGPVTAMSMIGFTVGGLVGPLLYGIVSRGGKR